MRRSILALAFTGAAGTLIPAAALAQGAPPVWPAPPQQSAPATMWPDPPTQSQPPAAQRPATTTAPARRAAPARAPTAAEPAPAGAPAAKPPKPAAARAAPARVVNCTGPFARTATQAQLEAGFGANNVQFTQVDGPGGAKLNATVVFPDDPKRRLEVLWHDEPNRARPSAIVITGSSLWLAPRGLKLGMALTEVEKRNGKPFKLNGFGGDTGGNVTDWDGGKLDQLGACRMGVRFRADSKASPEVVGKVTTPQSFTSKDADMLAAKPRAAEIVVGYGE